MKELNRFTCKRFDRLKKLLKSYPLDNDIETLHKIRVEIKKIKAINELVNNHVKGFHSHRMYVPLRDIFRVAGKIREPEVFYELLIRYEIEGIADSRIPGSGTQDTLLRKFQQEIPHYIDVVKSQKKRLWKVLVKIKAKNVRRYVKEREAALRLQLKGKWTKSALHKVRKTVKQILYLRETSRALRNGSGSFLDKMQELIGQWHDVELLLSVLRKNREENDVLKRLKIENEKNKRQIRLIVNEYYKQDKPR